MRALWRLYLYYLLIGLNFSSTVWMVFVLSRGGNAGWAEAGYHVGVLLAEVPTGSLADLFGRRRSILTGLALGVVGLAAYPWMQGTLSATLLLALEGVAASFLSGADTALLYEAAEAEGGPDLARRVLARCNMLRAAGWVIAPLAAGVLYEWQPLAPFLLRALVLAAIIAVVWGVREAPRPAVRQPGVWAQVRAAVGTVAGRPAIVVLLLFAWVWDLGITTNNLFGQAYFPALGLTMAAAGVALGIGHFASLVGSAAAEWLRAAAVGGVLRLGPLLVALAFLGMGLGRPLAAAVGYAAAQCLDGVIFPLWQGQINALIPSEQRATILSLSQLGFSLEMVFLFPAFSYLQPMARIWQVLGGAGLLLALLWLWRPRARCA